MVGGLGVTPGHWIDALFRVLMAPTPLINPLLTGIYMITTNTSSMPPIERGHGNHTIHGSEDLHREPQNAVGEHI